MIHEETFLKCFMFECILHIYFTHDESISQMPIFGLKPMVEGFYQVKSWLKPIVKGFTKWKHILQFFSLPFS